MQAVSFAAVTEGPREHPLLNTMLAYLAWGGPCSVEITCNCRRTLQYACTSGIGSVGSGVLIPAWFCHTRVAGLGYDQGGQARLICLVLRWLKLDLTARIHASGMM